MLIPQTYVLQSRTQKDMLADPRRRNCQVAVEKNGAVSRAYAILVKVSMHDLVRFLMYDEHGKNQVNNFRLHEQVI